MCVLTTLFLDFAARLCSTEFLRDARHPDHPTAFSRCPKLPLATLVALMLTGMRMSVQAELDTFFSHLRLQAQLVHEVSEQAFAQARAKLSLVAIPGLNDWLIARADQDGSLPRWRVLTLAENRPALKVFTDRKLTQVFYFFCPIFGRETKENDFHGNAWTGSTATPARQIVVV